MATATHLPTGPAGDEFLLRLPRDGFKYERVGGRIQMSPAGFRHGVVIMRLAARLSAFLGEHGECGGALIDSSTGYRLPGGNVRCPDLSFVSAARLPVGDLPCGFAEFAPDLAVEVLSSEERESVWLDKVSEYLQAGVRLVWVLDPERRRATTYRTLTDVRCTESDGQLEGGDVLPGFTCALADVFV
jgi:Uma2 family endonuclease